MPVGDGTKFFGSTLLVGVLAGLATYFFAMMLFPRDKFPLEGKVYLICPCTIIGEKHPLKQSTRRS